MKELFILLAFVTLLSPAMAQTSEVFVNEKGPISGYDVVSYFTGKPSRGNEEFSYSWNGATWLFASRENRETFKSDPSKYAPQFGGYCAYGMADGHKAPTQPDAWTVVDGKLYLNYDKNVQAEWIKDQKRLIQKAEENWPKVKKE